ncbi:MAG: MerR family DNA-binding transcriptional regulator [Steroidobacteraceae bacterium]
MSEYTQSSGQLAREAGISVQTVILYSDLGLIDHVRVGNGLRLFRPGEAEKVRTIFTERMATRGRRVATANPI